MSSKPALVGAFILGALALGVAGILLFGGMRLFATSSRVVVFFNESLAGLEVGSPVTFHGVRIGSVQSIAVVFSADTMNAETPVFLEIERNKVTWEGKTLSGSVTEAEQFVRAGLRAQLAPQSIVTGQLRVDLDFRPGTPAKLVGAAPGVAEIPAVPSELGQLRNMLTGLRLTELTDAAQQALAAVSRLSDHLDATIDPLAKSVQHTADAATQTLQTTDEAVHRLQADASGALRDLDSLIVDAHGQLDARGGELSQTLTAADHTVRHAAILLDSLNGLAEPRSQFRGNLEAAMRDLAASASSLRNFTATVERNPNALLMGRASR
jgi:paraquat-inducible protein B